MYRKDRYGHSVDGLSGMSNAVESLINAYKECTEWRDVSSGKEISIGRTFKEWAECMFSTDLPHWTWYEVVGERQVFRYRIGNVGYYERCAEIESIDEPVGIAC